MVLLLVEVLVVKTTHRNSGVNYVKKLPKYCYVQSKKI